MTAGALRALHVPGRPLILPNAWDADSARLVVEAGFPVVATSSAAVAAALGYSDGERAPAAEMFAAAGRIARAVEVPVTVDAESGYGLSGAELADALIGAGAVGCNFEDTAPGKGIRPLAEQVELLGALRDAAGDRLVVNARVDAFLRADHEEDALDEAVDRARAYLSAGADCVFPIHVRSADLLKSFVDAVAPAAVNATYFPAGPKLAELGALGVARVSLGTGLWRLARAAIGNHLEALSSGQDVY
ncbi:isocitrate lyase/PEP mutase family protein [Amycolatopsis sp. CA-230715]|uniref:isocitrate lyase/PEP mutase family protein n=1 Tax=Amycolatopsis sp. CA-230715 TaxID=2745196 RepID=UPI001C035DE0|nr:isocitrate lyase/phosphoenolpyruvate mutase family protein [Amycolatopsis sp. CA-230715]QWF82728.1 hypothetical protein HUW46_06167 [Amycolatopsis sp. CA-230715]